MTFTPFLDGLSFLLSSLQGDASKKIALIGEGSLSRASSLVEVLSLEIQNYSGVYSRVPYSPPSPVEDTISGSVYLPEITVNFTNSGGVAIEYTYTALLLGADTTPNRIVSSLVSGVFTIPNHTRVAGDKVFFTGDSQVGINLGQIYYVVEPEANSFKVALTPGGAPITAGPLIGSLICRFANGRLFAFQPANPDGSSKTVLPGATELIKIKLSLA